MKLKVSYFLLFGYCVGGYHAAFGNLTMFIRPFPLKKEAIIDDSEKLIEHIKTPGKLSGKTIKRKLLATQSNEGIFGTYLGYLALTDFNGQLTFPRKTQKPSFKLIITSRITPIFMIGNTIHHWEFDPRAKTSVYQIERKQDPATQLWFWQTTKGSVPENNIVPLDAIVLFAKPKHVLVPEGITMTTNNPQLLLPDIYAKKGLNITARALWVLTMKQFFGPLRTLFKKESNTYFSQHLNVK